MQPVGIGFRPELLEALDNYTVERGISRSEAVSQLIEKALVNYETAPLCQIHNQRMFRGKRGFYCVKADCREAQSFRLQK